MGFAIGAVLACLAIGAWLLSDPALLPHPDDLLAPPATHAATQAPLPAPTRDPFTAVARPSDTVAPSERSPVAAASTAPRSTRAPVAGGGTPTRPSRSPGVPSATPRPSASPTAVPAPPRPQNTPRCIINLLGIRICVGGD